MRTINVSAEHDADEGRWFIRVEVDGIPHFFTAPDTVNLADEIRRDIDWTLLADAD